MNADSEPPNHQPDDSLVDHWRKKFACAFRGIAVAIGRESSFRVHLPAAIAACGLAAWLEVSYTEWLVLVLAITVVLTAEAMNTAIEHLARAVTRSEHPDVRNALDVASGAVLIASLGASAVGVMVLVWHVVVNV